MRLVPALALAGLLAALPVQAARMWSGWQETSLAQAACVEVAAEAVRGMGFRPSRDSQSAFGWRGQDGISVRCLADRRVAVFFIFLQDSNGDGESLLQGLRDAFRGRPSGGSPGGKF